MFTMAEGRPRKILLAIDASENAKKAFDWLLANIYKPGDEIVIAHCPEPPKLPILSAKSGLNIPTEQWAKSVSEINERSMKLENEYSTLLSLKKIKYKSRKENYKNAGEGIITMLEEELADMVIMGTRGLGVVRRTILGSVSDYVVHHASVPVIVVPGVAATARRESNAAQRKMSDAARRDSDVRRKGSDVKRKDSEGSDGKRKGSSDAETKPLRKDSESDEK